MDSSKISSPLLKNTVSMTNRDEKTTDMILNDLYQHDQKSNEIATTPKGDDKYYLNNKKSPLDASEVY